MFKLMLRMIGVAFAAITMSLGAHAQAPIKIGAVLSISGPGALLGDPEAKTLQLYIEKINAEGGVLGRKLQLITYDDGTDADKANAFAKRLIEEDKVDFIVGCTTTGSTMAMVPVVEKAGVPFISFAGAVVVVEPVKKWVFKTFPIDRMVVEKNYQDMKKRGISKIGLLAENSGSGQSGKKEAHGMAGKYGIQIIAEEIYGPKDPDMTPQLTKMRNTPGVQAIFVWGFGQGPSIATKNYAQLGIKVPLYHANGVASDEFIKLAGKAAEGARLPAGPMLVVNELPNNDPQKPVLLSYLKTYRDRYKSDPSAFGGSAYDGLMIVVNAIKRAGSTDKAKVRDAIEQTKGFVGADGIRTMSPKDHVGLDLNAFRMLEVRNGAWKLVW